MHFGLQIMFVHKIGFFLKPITWLLFFKPIIGLLFAFVKCGQITHYVH